MQYQYMSFGVVSPSFSGGRRRSSGSAIVGGKRDPLRAKYTLGTYYGHFVLRLALNSLSFFCIVLPTVHTVRNLHFLSKNSTLISREKMSNCFDEKSRENAAVLHFLAIEAIDNFDFPRKIVDFWGVKNS